MESVELVRISYKLANKKPLLLMHFIWGWLLRYTSDSGFSLVGQKDCIWTGFSGDLSYTEKILPLVLCNWSQVSITNPKLLPWLHAWPVGL